MLHEFWEVSKSASGEPNVGITGMRQPINCRKTGVTLGILQVAIIEGAAPFVQNFDEVQLVHPFFGTSDYHLLGKLRESLDFCWERSWEVDQRHIERVQILMVAIMDRLGCYRAETAVLPATDVAVGSSHRLWHLANWWMTSTTRRIVLPQFYVSRRNGNDRWQNFRSWLDAAFEHKTQWESQKKRLETEEELKIRESAAKEVRKIGSRRQNLTKIWNWVELQLREHVHSGRLRTFKELFFTADISPENWIKDDIDDFAEALMEHTDIGSELALFVRDRVELMYAAQEEFYSGFMVVNKAQQLFTEVKTQREEAAENALFADLDAEVSQWESLPPPPDERQFAGNLVAKLKANAQYLLRVQRWKLLQARKLDPNVGKQIPAPIGTLQRFQQKIEDARAQEMLREDDDSDDGDEPEPAMI